MKMNLDGVWDFAFTKSVEDTPCYNSAMAVPGCFDVAGLYYPQRGCGWYRKNVKIAEAGTYRLRIASSGMRTAVYCDGKLLKDSYLAWSPSEVEFQADKGFVEIVIRTDNFSKGHPLFRDFYDFYPFGGIFDHVTMEKVEADEIRSIQVFPLSHTTGEIEIHVETTAATLQIAFDGVDYKTMPTQNVFRCNVPNFKVWSPDTPNLHTVTINGKDVTFGIRTLDWSGPDLLLNGEKIKLLGVNRHDSHPEFGSATPESLIASDLVMLKEAGFNFVRGSHYPQREFLFDTCDRLGLLVWEEPLAWGNCHKPTWGNGKVPDDFEENSVFVETLAEQLEVTIRNSINHPSLIIHGFLNECESQHEAVRDVIKRYMDICHRMDPTRPATFACNRMTNDISIDLSDIQAINIYPAWYSDEGVECIVPTIDKYLKEKISDKKPFMISEIGASAIYGDHSGVRWSEEYQSELCCTVLEKVLTDPRCNGLALWHFANANTYINNVMGISRPRGFNNKGLLDEYRRPKLAWRDLSKRVKEYNKNK